MLDEFEELVYRREQFTFDFYESLRYLMNQGALALIPASKTPLIDLAQTLGYTSPFFNIFTHLPLGELTDAEARQLLARGATCDRPFTSQEQAKLLALAGRHPYKLQLAGSLLYLAKAESRPVNWSSLRRTFTEQLQQVGLETPLPKRWGSKLRSALRWPARFPSLLGRAVLESLLRLKKDDVSETTAWMIGALLLLLLALVLLRYIKIDPQEILNLLERLRGK